MELLMNLTASVTECIVLASDLKGTFLPGNMYGTQLNFNPKKRLTLYDQNGKRRYEFGSRQAKRQQSQNHPKYGNQRVGTTDSYPYYGTSQKFNKVNRKARQLPHLCKFHILFIPCRYLLAQTILKAI